MTHLWEMETSWCEKRDTEYSHSTYTDKSWKDFQEYKPYKLWKPYILSSWSWKKGPIPTKPYVKRGHKDGYDVSKQLRANASAYDLEKNTQDIIETAEDRLQIVFLSPVRFLGMHRVELIVKEEEEDAIKEWLKNHMPSFWKL